MRTALCAVAMLCLSATGQTLADDGAPWREIPLTENDKVSGDWKFIGYGSFSIADGAIKTEPDERGLGLLVYSKEKFGDCQIRVVFRPEDRRSNAGVYVRIDDGVFDAEQPTPVKRNADGSLSETELAKMQEASEKEQGPWYAVHHGYEVQIIDSADPGHRTGSIYSLAESKPAPPAEPGAWRTMIITLRGEQILVDVDGKRVATFDATAADLPERKIWHEPKREPKRPLKGYIGLQTHDPGDVVYFKELSVRPLK